MEYQKKFPSKYSVKKHRALVLYSVTNENPIQVINLF